VAPQRSLARVAHVAGARIDLLAARAEAKADLGGQHGLVSTIDDRTADQLLVVAVAVHVGGVDQRHAHIQRPLDRARRLGVVALAVREGHAHAPQAQRRHAQSLPRLRCCIPMLLCILVECWPGRHASA